MANDGPSGDKNNKLPTGKKAGRPEQLDLSALREQLAPMLRDPADEFVTTQATRPGSAPQTPGPHRYTIFVPKDDKTILNLGQGIGPLGVGISALTQTTVLAYATGEIKTALSLGTATPSGRDANATTDGYALDTMGASSHFADGYVISYSRDSGMTLRAKNSLQLLSDTGALTGSFGAGISLSTPGNFSLTVGEDPKFDVSKASVFGAVMLLGADALDVANPALGSKPAQGATDASNLTAAAWGEFLEGNSNKMRDYVIAKVGTIGDKALQHAATVTSLILGFKRISKQSEPGKSAWKSWDGASWVISAAAEGLKLYQDFVKPLVKDADAPNVGIKAKGTVEIEAGKSASLIAPGGVAISGFKSVDVSSLAVGIKGHKDASVFGGITASLKSLAGGVQVQSDLKDVFVSGKTEVKVQSESGPAILTGETFAQLNSVNGMAYVHGGSGVYVGAGEAAGFGMKIDPSSLRIGEVSNAKEHAKAVVNDPGRLLKIDKASVSLISKGSGAASMLELKGGKILGTCQALDVDADGNLTLDTKSGKVLIG